METKKCFKCGEIKPLSEFYKHPKTADGHLNKCKCCTKKDVIRNYVRKSQDPQYMEMERQRGRDKYRRLDYRHKYSRPSNTILSGLNKRARSQGYDLSGKELHHWNYNKLYSVFILSRAEHRRIHRYVHRNREDNFCYFDEIKIETEEQAIEITNYLLKKCGFTREVSLVNLL